jgi:hypothetical protein
MPMHLEVLVEDQSGKKTLDLLLPKIIGSGHTFAVHSYKGIGRIPKNMKTAKNANNRMLLDNLPRLLRGYGKAFSGYGKNYRAAVVLVCDLDDKCLKDFRRDLISILHLCLPRPETRFCIAIEEGEAWFLGDLNAIRKAYPKAKEVVLSAYVNDSICGTWEKVADAVYPGGSPALSAKGWQAVGAEKSKWAREITPQMDPTRNSSPSFCYFKDKILELVGML